MLLNLSDHTFPSWSLFLRVFYQQLIQRAGRSWSRIYLFFGGDVVFFPTVWTPEPELSPPLLRTRAGQTQGLRSAPSPPRLFSSTLVYFLPWWCSRKVTDHGQELHLTPLM